MSQTYEFYATRAAEAEAAAGKAALDNVRDRELRAAATWHGLAEQAKQVALGREKAIRDKAEARALEEAAAAEAPAQ